MTTPSGPDTAPAGKTGPAEIDAVMIAARVLVGVTASSVAAVEDRITLPQLRVLVMISSRGPLNLAAVAAGLSLHPSNISRACERLVTAGLLDRTDNPTDRRNLVLELTEEGRRLVAQVDRQRRDAIATILARMPRRSREGLIPALRAFADAADERADPDAWQLGWTTA